MSYGFVFKIISLVLAVCCPIIMITMFPLRSSLSWYWDTPAVPLFILTTIPTSYFFLTTTGWKLPGICLLLLTIFPVTTHGYIHNVTAVLFFVLSGYALMQSTKSTLLVKSLYLLASVACGLHLLLGEIYMIWVLCLHHGIVSYRLYKAQKQFANRLDN